MQINLKKTFERGKTREGKHYWYNEGDGKTLPTILDDTWLIVIYYRKEQRETFQRQKQERTNDIYTINVVIHKT